jgi:Domain of unknown function (DUF4160)
LNLGGDGNFQVYVFARDHPPPHFHVYRRGQLLGVYWLATLTPRLGSGPMPKDVRAWVLENFDRIQRRFDEFHPPRA